MGLVLTLGFAAMVGSATPSKSLAHATQDSSAFVIQSLRDERTTGHPLFSYYLW
jgi:hypothetical protein